MDTKKPALSQPLESQPDYDTCEDELDKLMAELEKLMAVAEKDIENKKTQHQKEASSDYDAAMLKMIPPIEDYDAPCKQEAVEPPCIEDYDEGPQPIGPKVIVIENYNSDDAPEVVKRKPTCCPVCGQDIPAKMERQAHCMDSSFKKIMDILRASDLKESQLRVIYSNLDKIYKKYRELEED